MAMTRWGIAAVVAVLSLALSACDSIPSFHPLAYDSVSVVGDPGTPSFVLSATGRADDPRPSGRYVVPMSGPNEESPTCVQLDGNTATVNTQTEFAPFAVTTWRITSRTPGSADVEGFKLQRNHARDCSPVPSKAVADVAYRGAKVQTWVDGQPVNNPGAGA
jgi:hypothetical protein